MPGVPATTPAESGAIGAACEVPETAATIKVATAIAKIVRIIVVLLGTNPEDKHCKNGRGSAPFLLVSGIDRQIHRFRSRCMRRCPRVDGTFRHRLRSSIDVTTAALGHAPQ